MRVQFAKLQRIISQRNSISVSSPASPMLFQAGYSTGSSGSIQLSPKGT